MVPSFSPYAAAGSTTSACAADCVMKVSSATTKRAPAMPRRARSASATSLSGSAPRSTRHATFPLAAASSTAAVSPPSEGARPRPSAPRTFPRRRTGSTVAAGTADRRASSADTVVAADSARFARPATTTTLPPASCAAISGSARTERTASGCVPGSQRTERHACPVSPVSWLAISMMRRPRFVAASRRRMWRTGSSSLRSGARSTTVPAAHAESMVAWGSERTDAGRPSSICASRMVLPTASARRPHMNASSLVPRAPPRTATAPPDRISRATASSAADHEVAVSPPSRRISGVSRRSSEFTDWKLKRPRSHIQPQLTGSLSTPW